LTVGGVALRSSLVVRERGTVTGLVMEGSMMVTEAADLASSVEPTTVRSSELTTMRRTTAVRDRLGLGPARPAQDHQSGAPGLAGSVWLLGLSGENRSARGNNALYEMVVWAPSTPRRDTPTLTVSDTARQARQSTIENIYNYRIPFIIKILLLKPFVLHIM